MVAQGYTEMGEIASQQVTESNKEGGVLHTLKQKGQDALDAVSTDSQKQKRSDEQLEQKRKEAAKQASEAQQTVLGTVSQVAQDGLQSARDLLQGVSSAAGQQAGQADAEAQHLAQHDQAPQRAL